MEKALLRLVGLVLVMVGVFLVLSSLAELFSHISPTAASGGVVILVGPIPLSMGFGPYGMQLLVITLAFSLFLMAIAFMFLIFERSGTWEDRWWG